jgi:hypothetical protein
MTAPGPRSPTDPASATPAAFVASDGRPPMTPESSAPPDLTAATLPGQPEKVGDSAASMATEILSAAPRTPVVESTETGPTTLAQDVTIMAKGRRRRFRLH